MNIEANIKKVREYLKEKNLDSFYVSSYDPYLCEYVPLDDCHRYYFTGFTGSTAEVLITEYEVYLFVDGRYHEQADKEVDSNLITVMKSTMEKGNIAYLRETIEKFEVKSIAYESERTPRSTFKKLEELGIKMISFDLSNIISFTTSSNLAPVKFIADELTGRTTGEKLSDILESDEAYFISSLDSIAWLSNCRGYHGVDQSAYFARAFATREMLYVFVGNDCPIDESVTKNSSATFIQANETDMVEKIVELSKELSFSKISCTPNTINSFDYNLLKDIFGEKLIEVETSFAQYHSSKNPTELKVMGESFLKASHAILNSIKETKAVYKNSTVSEKSFKHLVNANFRKEGALAQSFGTISAFGKNSSVIHYSDASDKELLVEGEFALLDCGGYFDSGYATDTTRTFCVGTPSQKHKEIYTLVLKGILQCENAVFPEGYDGSHLDFLARKPLFEKGFNFAHGTGHGVGIAVHESGAGISTRSGTKIRENQTLSIEPGLYIPDFGGVRLENVVKVVKHPEFEGMLKFETFVFVPYDMDLIDESMLNSDEKVWLAAYHVKCEQMGFTF